MMKAADEVIESVIGRYEQRLAAAKKLRDLLAECPDLVKDLFEVLSVREAIDTLVIPEKHRGIRSGKSTNYERIRQVLMSKQNQWTSTPSLIEATGLERGAVGGVLFTTHCDKFEKKDQEGKRVKLWRLRHPEEDADE